MPGRVFNCGPTIVSRALASADYLMDAGHRGVVELPTQPNRLSVTMTLIPFSCTKGLSPRIIACGSYSLIYPTVIGSPASKSIATYTGCFSPSAEDISTVQPWNAHRFPLFSSLDLLCLHIPPDRHETDHSG